MLLRDQSASVTWQSASRIPHGALVAFYSSAVYLFLKTPVTLKTPIIPKTPIMFKTLVIVDDIDEVPAHGSLFSLLHQVFSYF